MRTRTFHLRVVLALELLRLCELFQRGLDHFLLLGHIVIRPRGVRVVLTIPRGRPILVWLQVIVCWHLPPFETLGKVALNPTVHHGSLALAGPPLPREKGAGGLLLSGFCLPALDVVPPKRLQRLGALLQKSAVVRATVVEVLLVVRWLQEVGFDDAKHPHASLVGVVLNAHAHVRLDEPIS